MWYRFFCGLGAVAAIAANRIVAGTAPSSLEKSYTIVFPLESSVSTPQALLVIASVTVMILCGYVGLTGSTRSPREFGSFVAGAAVAVTAVMLGGR